MAFSTYLNGYFCQNSRFFDFLYIRTISEIRVFVTLL